MLVFHSSIATNNAGTVIVTFQADGADENDVTAFNNAVNNGDLDAALAAEGLTGVAAANLSGQVVAASTANSVNTGDDGIGGTGNDGAANAAADDNAGGAAPAAGTSSSMLMMGTLVVVGVLFIAVIGVGVVLMKRSRNNSSRLVPMNAQSVAPVTPKQGGSKVMPAKSNETLPPMPTSATSAW